MTLAIIDVNKESIIMKKFNKITVTAVSIVILLTIGVGVYFSNNNNQNKKVTATASFYPLYEFTKNIGGDKVEVINITPAGSEPHGFEPSAKQLATAYKSDVFIYNGADMETWADNFLKDYKNTIVKSSDNVSLLEISEDNNNLRDPHFWLDPVAAKKIVDNILAGLIKASPENKAYFTDNANNYKDKLIALDKSFKDGLSECKTDTAITSHDAFNYMANRYDLKLLSISGIDPSVEPDAAKLAEISDLVKSNGINYIFFESLTSPKLAETIANETGAKTSVLDPIGGLSEESQQKGDSYVTIQQRNLKNLRMALDCK